MATPEGLCECGCGRPAPIATATRVRFGHVKGQPTRFIRGHANRKPGPDWLEEDRGYVTPCWIWQRHVRPKDGYGHAGHDFAHRVVYRRFRGDIPKGLELDHLCRVPACVNPDHLQAVTRRENAHRGLTGAHRRKLTPKQRYEVMRSTGSRSVVAAQYGISVHYVTELRGGRNPKWQ